MNKPLILTVEDDGAVRNLITTALEINHYRFLTASTGQEAVLETVSHNPGVVLLDLGLADLDGVEVIRKIRSWSQVPIIVVSARNEDGDKIEALDAGADDYLTKPFSVEELMARLRVMLRRQDGRDGNPHASVYVNGTLRIDYAGGCVSMKGQELHLTPIEYKLLCLLAKNTGKVLTHTYLACRIWSNEWDNDVACLRVFMATLRKKIEEDPSNPKYIQTRIGVGYRMVEV